MKKYIGNSFSIGSIFFTLAGTTGGYFEVQSYLQNILQLYQSVRDFLFSPLVEILPFRFSGVLKDYLFLGLTISGSRLLTLLFVMPNEVYIFDDKYRVFRGRDTRLVSIIINLSVGIVFWPVILFGAVKTLLLLGLLRGKERSEQIVRRVTEDVHAIEDGELVEFFRYSDRARERLDDAWNLRADVYLGFNIAAAFGLTVIFFLISQSVVQFFH